MRKGDSIAVVTGGGRGLGLAITDRLARDGFHVISVDLDIDAGTKTVVDLQRQALRCDFRYCDVSASDSVRALVEGIEKDIGPIEVWVNNAAVFAESLALVDISDNEWDRVLKTNLNSVFYCLRETAKVMVGRGSGSIVNVSSFVGKVGRVVYSTAGSPAKAHYCASKAGIISLTKSLAHELAPSGIRVNAVAPGSITAGEGYQEKERLLLPFIPLGRVGRMAEVAEAVAFLASDRASFITGEILDVNGGTLMD